MDEEDFLAVMVSVSLDAHWASPAPTGNPVNVANPCPQGSPSRPAAGRQAYYQCKYTCGKPPPMPPSANCLTECADRFSRSTIECQLLLGRHRVVLP